jgi:hypothetical protein
MGAKGERRLQGETVAARARTYDDRRRGGSVVDGEGGRAITTRERGQRRGGDRSGTCGWRPVWGVSAAGAEANGARDAVLGSALVLGGADASSCVGAGPARRVHVPAGDAAATNAPGGAKQRRTGPTPEDVGPWCYLPAGSLERWCGCTAGVAMLCSAVMQCC